MFRFDLAIVAFLAGILLARILIDVIRFGERVAKRTAKYFKLSNRETLFMYLFAIAAVVAVVLYA